MRSATASGLPPAAQNPALADPNTYLTQQPHWFLLDTSIRAEYWTWSYFQVLGSPGWTGAANTLFLYKLDQHGDFLSRVAPSPLSSNRVISHAKGLLNVAEMFPEFTGAASWETYARDLLFKSMAANFSFLPITFATSLNRNTSDFSVSANGVLAWRTPSGARQLAG